MRDEKTSDHDPGRSSAKFASLLGAMPGEKRSRYERDTTQASKGGGDGDVSERRRRRREDEDEADSRRPAQAAAEDEDDEEDDDLGRSAKRYDPPAPSLLPHGAACSLKLDVSTRLHVCLQAAARE